MRKLFCLLAAIVVFAGCSSSSVVRLTDEQFAPTPEDQTIEVYQSEPDTSMVRIARVSAQQEATTIFGSVSEADVIPALKKQAREVGATALVNVDFEIYETGREVQAMKASGVGVRFQKQ